MLIHTVAMFQLRNRAILNKFVSAYVSGKVTHLSRDKHNEAIKIQGAGDMS